MITFSKLKSSTIDQGKRILKVLQFGAKTANESGPFGVDSSPIENMTAIFSETSNAGESVIIGYINKSQLSEPGETRLFSMDNTGVLKAELWLKNDGSIIMNGGGFSAVRFENLNAKLSQEVTDINTELTKISAAISNLGGVYITAPISLDISNCESETIKLK
jgi:hypothetical protein